MSAEIAELRRNGVAAVETALSPETASAMLSAHVAALSDDVSAITNRLADAIERIGGERPPAMPYRAKATPRGSLNALAAQIEEAQARLAHLGNVATFLNRIG